jgi:SAM-dependent methyltransferase
MGDVSLLASELVGPAGEVVAIDRSPEVTAAAAKRIANSGVENVRFKTADIEHFHADGMFDAVVGRFVLLHQAEPVNVLRAAASFVRPGGAVAFQEMNPYAAVRSSPAVPLWDLIGNQLLEIALLTMPGKDVARSFPHTFRAAGLAHPRVRAETPAGGEPGSLLYPWLATAFAVLKPHLERMGISTSAAGDPATLEERLIAAATQECSQLMAFEQVVAWTRC